MKCKPVLVEIQIRHISLLAARIPPYIIICERVIVRMYIHKSPYTTQPMSSSSTSTFQDFISITLETNVSMYKKTITFTIFSS